MTTIFKYFIFAIIINTIIVSTAGSVLETTMFLLFITGSISLTGFLYSIFTQKLSLNIIYSFFSYVFFFIVPLVQISQNSYTYFFNDVSTKALIQQVLIYILLFHLVYYALYYFLIRKWIIIPEISFKRKIPGFKVILLTFIVILVLYLSSLMGIEPFLFRSAENVLSQMTSESFNLFYVNFFRPLTVIIFLLEYNKKRFGYSKGRVAWIWGLIALVMNFPLAVPRFYLFAILLSVYCIFLMKRERNGAIFLFLLPVGIVSSFYIDAFRYVNNFSDLSLSSIQVSLTKAIHFDAFEALMLSVKYVNTKDILMGSNFFGALFFFVPRSIWPSKPEPTSFILIGKNVNPKSFEDPNFNNISCPLIGESFIGFGIFGLVFISLVLALISSLLDSYVRLTIGRKERRYNDENFFIFFASLMGFYLLMLRGTFMVAFAYSVGFFAAYLAGLYSCNLKLSFKIRKLKFR